MIVPSSESSLSIKLHVNSPTPGAFPLSRLRSAGLLVLCLSITPTITWPARGQEAASPESRARLAELAASYKSLEHYSDNGSFSLSVMIGGQAQKRDWPLKVQLSRPSRIVVESEDVRLLADGEKLATEIQPTHKYLIEAAPAVLKLSALTEGPLGASLLGSTSADPARILLTLLLDPDPVSTLLEPGFVLSMAENNADLLLQTPAGYTYRLVADPETNLLTRIELQTSAEKLEAASPPGLELTDLQVSWNAGTISTAPLPDKTFLWEPTEGYTQVAELEAPAQDDKGDKAAHPLVGKPAPQFSLNTLEPDQKTRRLTSDDLAGRVVLLDFWATWCGPCLKELPEIARLIDDLAAAGKPVVVVAVSQDRNPREGDVRSLVETTIKDQRLDLLKPPVGLVALDPEMALGQAFKVEALPTLVLLDQQGKIHAVHIGYKDDIREQLMRQIDGLLETKQDQEK